MGQAEVRHPFVSSALSSVDTPGPHLGRPGLDNTGGYSLGYALRFHPCLPWIPYLWCGLYVGLATHVPCIEEEGENITVR